MSTTTYRHQGDLWDHTLAADAKAGDILLAENQVVQVTVDGKAGDTVGVRAKGVISGPIADAVGTVAQGGLVYWNAGNNNFDTTPTNFIAIVAQDGGIAAGTGRTADVFISPNK